MTDKYCGWSDSKAACYEFTLKSSDKITSCGDFVDTSNTDNKLTKFNDLTCSSFSVSKACFRDK